MNQTFQEFKNDLLYAYHDYLQENVPLTMDVLIEYEQEIEMELEAEREMDEMLESCNQWNGWGLL